MNETFEFYKVLGLPDKPFDACKIFECVGKRNFMLIYDLAGSLSIIGLSATDPQELQQSVVRGIPGMALLPFEYHLLEGNLDTMAFPVYKNIEKFDNKSFNDIFDVIPKKGFLAVIFINTDLEGIGSIKMHLESVLSSKSIRETGSSFKTYFSSRVSSTISRDIYHESEERLMLSNIIDSLNKAILGNGLAYKIFLLLPKSSTELRKYVDIRVLMLAEYNFKDSIENIVDYLSKRPCIPFGVDYCKEFMNFYGFHNVNHVVSAPMPLQEGGIEVGKFMKDGVLEADLPIVINPTSINLGFLITGLPGSGKTREAMSIIDSLELSEQKKKPAIFIITPTTEWREFASEHRMFFVKLYEDSTPINFFRCPNTIETEKFYGNLAMILSSAANAGPYRNPMEKCMLNAFRKIYAQTTIPEPTQVYNEIEESIIRYHGRRTSAGVKYTKHGENIKSALENLRGILNREQYSVRDGIKIEDFLENGAVFDVSAASSSTKTQLYALVLNQIYALTNNFDANGDNELRLVICLEEAQTIFEDPDSPAVQDIKQRIQDFRKQGIGLILLAHNVTDIDVGVRRLCQIKLYLKQAPDTALLASKDLIFANVEQDDLTLKLKTLGSRSGAFSYVSKSGNEKTQQDTIFIKTKIYENKADNYEYNPIIDYKNKHNISATRVIRSKIALKLGEYNKIKSDDLQDSYYVQVRFLGEEVATIPLKGLDSSEISLLEGKEYTIHILNKKERVLKEFFMKAAEKMFLDVGK